MNLFYISLRKCLPFLLKYLNWQVGFSNSALKFADIKLQPFIGRGVYENMSSFFVLFCYDSDYEKRRKEENILFNVLNTFNLRLYGV